MNISRSRVVLSWVALSLCGCMTPDGDAVSGRPVPDAGFLLKSFRTHNKFSRTIPPVLTVPSGAVVRLETKEATDGQLGPDSTADDVMRLDFELIHPLTGPILVEGAVPGDVLAVTLHRIEVASWGWSAVVPGFGFLADGIGPRSAAIFSVPLLVIGTALAFHPSLRLHRTPDRS